MSRLAWYQDRAEHHGHMVGFYLRRLAEPTCEASFWYAEQTYERAREAGHYANLVLDARDEQECRQWLGNARSV